MALWKDYKITSPYMDDPNHTERLIFLSRLTGRSVESVKGWLPPYVIVSVETLDGAGNSTIKALLQVIRAGLRMPITWDKIQEARNAYNGDMEKAVVIPISNPLSLHNANHAHFIANFPPKAPRPKNRGIEALETLPGGGNALALLKEALGPNYASLLYELPPVEVIRQYLLKAGHTSDPQALIALVVFLYPQAERPGNLSAVFGDIYEAGSEADQTVLSGLADLTIEVAGGGRMIVELHRGSIVVNGRSAHLAAAKISVTNSQSTPQVGDNKPRFNWD